MLVRFFEPSTNSILSSLYRCRSVSPRCLPDNCMILGMVPRGAGLIGPIGSIPKFACWARYVRFHAGIGRANDGRFDALHTSPVEISCRGIFRAQYQTVSESMNTRLVRRARQNGLRNSCISIIAYCCSCWPCASMAAFCKSRGPVEPRSRMIGTNLIWTMTWRCAACGRNTQILLGRGQSTNRFLRWNQSSFCNHSSGCTRKLPCLHPFEREATS